MRGRILFGLSAISGLGTKAVQAILDARRDGGRFRDIYDFCERVDLTAVNRGAIEALIKAGAFDGTGAMRRALMEIAGSAIDYGQGAQRDRRAGQMSMFGDLGGAAPPPPIPASEWSEAEMLLHEKQTLGFYVTKHPLAQHVELIRQFGTANTADVKAIAAKIAKEPAGYGGGYGGNGNGGNGYGRRSSGPNVVVGGMISSVRNVPIKQGRSAGKKMAIVLLEDLVGSIEAIVFPDSLEEMQPLLRPDTVVFVTAEIDTRREEPCLRVNRITPLERVRQELADRVVIHLRSLGGPLEQMEQLRSLCRSHRGRCPVSFRIQSAEGWTATVEAGDAARVNPTDDFMAGAAALIGADRVQCLGSRGVFSRN